MALIYYEYPFTEGIRTMLRLERLFTRLAQLVPRDSATDHHYALATLFEIMDVTSRTDFRTDLLQELARQHTLFEGYRGNPSISEGALNLAIDRISSAHRRLQATPPKPEQALASNEWLMSVRSRSIIPGCSFQVDLPYYYAWLQGDPAQRREDIFQWAQPFRPLHDCLHIVLRLLRESAQRSRASSQNGSYQMQLGGKTFHLAQVRLDPALGAVPEFSANKYMLWIRFGRIDQEFRTRPVEEPVDFELSLCNL